MADRPLDWFEFYQTSKSVPNSTQGKTLNPNKYNRRSADTSASLPIMKLPNILYLK